jgi:PLP dependent protein
MIADNVKRILAEIPKEVILVAAAKGHTADEAAQAICAGVTAIGENYVQEAQSKFEAVSGKAQYHLVGHLQKNKAKIAARLFDVIETLDSLELAAMLDKECAKLCKSLEVLIEVNCAGESQKHGVLPEDVEDFAARVCETTGNLKVAGLMTMGPVLDDPEKLRPFFRLTRELFETIAKEQTGRSSWKYLSMGMSDSYKVGIEEGANIIRVGTAIFGPRRV